MFFASIPFLLEFIEDISNNDTYWIHGVINCSASYTCNAFSNILQDWLKTHAYACTRNYTVFPYLCAGITWYIYTLMVSDSFCSIYKFSDELRARNNVQNYEYQINPYVVSVGPTRINVTTVRYLCKKIYVSTMCHTSTFCKTITDLSPTVCKTEIIL